MATTITLEDLRTRLKRNVKVLWPYRGEVEEGSVTFVNGNQVSLAWLEGYKHRDDTINLNEVLAVHDPKGVEHTLGSFTGKGHLTRAGARWLKEHPKT